MIRLPLTSPLHRPLTATHPGSQPAASVRLPRPRRTFLCGRRGCLLGVLTVTLALLTANCRAATSTHSSAPRTLSMDRPEISQALFYPRKAARNTPPANAIDIDVPAADGATIACRLHSHAAASPTLIFWHGNAEIIPDYDEIGPMYVQEQLNFLIVEYRGYGWSTGTPSASALLADSRAVFLAAKDWLGSHGYTGALFVMGRSLGSAAAIEVAASHAEEIGGLIIESGFAKTLPLFKVLGIDPARLGIDEEQTFNNADKIARVAKPTLILHGQRDQLIPLWQAETLQAESGAKNKELQVVPGADHNSLIAVAGPLYFQTIRKFVEKAAGIAPDWRERRRQFKEQQARQAAGEAP